MDIKAGILTAVFLIILGILLMVWNGIQSIRSVQKIRYFRMRHDRLMHGWRMLFGAFLLILIALWLGNYGEPTIYKFYAPSTTPSLTPTITMTPTITLTPTISSTPSVTRTPAISDTPTPTSTPFVPPEIKALFTSLVTPNPDALFSPLTFGRSCQVGSSGFLEAVGAATVFQNPIKGMVAVYSTDKMLNDVQWTALWYRDGTLINAETKPWTGGSGTYDCVEWAPDPSAWLPGNYELQIFVGLEPKVVGRFTVQGTVPTVRPTLRPSDTATITATLAPHYTLTETQTRLPTVTPLPSHTPIPSNTLVPTLTPSITRTPLPSDTAWPHPTPTITQTRTPTSTPRPTDTPWTQVPD